MVYIKNQKMDIISKSRNLRGLRTYAGKHTVEKVTIRERVDGTGILEIQFGNGTYCMTDFASFIVLKESVRNWRNLWGAYITVFPKGKPASFSEVLTNKLECLK